MQKKTHKILLTGRGIILKIEGGRTITCDGYEVYYMGKNRFHEFLECLNRLEAEHIPYTLSHCRTDAVMVSVSLPGERWEIEFFDNGTVEVEKFISDGMIHKENTLHALFERCRE